MKTEYTPGPWSIGDRPAGEWWHIYSGNQAICTALACSKKHTPVYATMFRANAVLIATAPELLDELENCADLLSTCFPDAPVDSCIGVSIIKARVAISKATGEANEKVEVPTAAE